MIAVPERMNDTTPQGPTATLATPRHVWWRWGAVAAAVLVLILGPYALFGEALERWTRALFAVSQTDPWFAAGACAALLASDLFLPIPSSLVSTAAGSFAGFTIGTLASSCGLTLGCVLGFWAGRASRRGTYDRWLSKNQFARFDALSQRLGGVMLVVVRPVPVLAEASVLFAGLGSLSFRRFMMFVVPANFGVSAAYAAVGAYAVNVDSFLLAFVGALGLPALTMWAARRWLPAPQAPHGD